MKGLKYLFITIFKNRIKEILKHPSKLILAILFIIIFASVFIVSFIPDNEQVIVHRNITELYAIIFILYYMMFILNGINGLTSGASFYTMADINLLFVSPISSKKILIFGLLKQMETSLFVGFFLLFQYSWLNGSYNINPLGMFAIFLGYCLTLFCSQVVALAAYTFTSGHETVKKVIKNIAISITILIVGYILLNALPSSNFLDSAINAINTDFFLFIPIAGWLKMFVIGVTSGISYYIILGLGLTFISVLLLIIFILKCNADFYEDVLQATERTFSAITAAKEGKIADTSPSKIKLGKTGIGRGKGANVFFYKHLLENRRGIFFILDMPSLAFIVVCLIFAFIMREGGILPIFVFATYMQIFNISMGRWIKELIFPYVYMIPVSPFKKLIAICKESILKISFEAVLLFIPMAFILNLSPNELIVAIIARISFGLIIISGNILTERLFGTVVNKLMILTLFFLTIVIVALPGIIAGIVAAIIFPTLIISPVTISFLVISIWNTFAVFCITFLCRDILNYAELNNK